ncbi:hypothetical protein [Dechloromonas sp. HYN0024]|uniref:hypothetical protein n=1 Tax=Dechloromonas sp. HYN0024 TaxID=2231055 RepID=UPI000E431061|nr:hypothetical protein [Dechloromonas sp. HYN0024]AXS80664.1 hypothetical protein HYN24_11920 [Dechloromonas sp. HYN0024]
MDSTRPNSPFQQGSTPGPVARLVAFVLSASLLVLGFMFSLVALAVVAVIGVVLGGWLWWKTRPLRKQMQQMRETQQMGNPEPAFDEPAIEGEFIRELPPEQRLR